MIYYDDNKNNEYIDEYHVHKDDENKEEKKQNKKLNISKKYIIIFIIVIIILIIEMFFFIYINKQKKQSHILKNIIIENNTYSPSFSPNIYDYYLLTEDKKLTIECKITNSREVEGCNEKIDLSNYYNYIHQIIVIENNTKKIYKIYIKVKESETEQNISIESIDGLNNDWTNKNKSIKINAKSENKIIGYSFDNGLTWQESNTYEVEENDNLKVVVQDEYGNKSAVRQINIHSIDKTLPTGTIIKEESNNKKITLRVMGKDDESGIDSYSWNNKDYSDEKTFTVTKKGNYYVTIKDKAGNISEKIIITIKDSDFKDKKQYGAIFYKNGSTNISNDYLSCTANDGICKITLPDISRDNSEIIGWSEDKNSKEAQYSPNEKISLEKNVTLYAITKKELTASFENETSKKEKCTIYNDDKYCYIKTPKINSNNKIIGWNTNKDSDTILEGENNLIKLYEDTTYYALAFKKVTVNFDLNGADNISSRKEICNLEASKNSCIITTPNIEREASNIIGWSTNKNATTADVLPNTKVQVDTDTTYYAITEKNITVTFDKNGSDTISKNTETCTFFNNNNNCQITTPAIYRNGSNIIGWSTNKNSKTSEVNENTNIIVNQDITYYAITSKEVYATFELNGADDISSNVESCTLYNTGICKIITPEITRDNWNILGWNTNKTAAKEFIKTNSELEIKTDQKYYAITYKKVTATYYQNTADSLGNCTNQGNGYCTESCNIYNTNTSCQVNVPYIYSKGNEVQFFSTSKDSEAKTGYSPAQKLNIYNNIELNAIVNNKYRHYTYSITKTKNYGYTAFETESGCPTTVYNNYYNFVDKLYKDAPYIFRAAKVTFTSDTTFSETWGNYSGMTYGYGVGYRNVDVKCPSTYSDYYLETIVHELTHSWDSYFLVAYGSYLSSTPEIKSLYNKYKNASSRPLRAYSYTNEKEFVADVYAWYYFLYVNTENQPKMVKQNLYYPNDLKQAIEKYINIAKSGYK